MMQVHKYADVQQVLLLNTVSWFGAHLNVAIFLIEYISTLLRNDAKFGFDNLKRRSVLAQNVDLNWQRAKCAEYHRLYCSGGGSS